MASITNVKECCHLSSSDITLAVMPFFHVHGLIGVVLSTFFSGGRLIIPYKFSASHFWEQITKYSVTWYSAVPTIHQLVLRFWKNLDNIKLRFIRSCSAPLAQSILEEIEKNLHVPVIEAYGMTEGAHQISSNLLPPGKRKVISDHESYFTQFRLAQLELGIIVKLPF